MPYFLAYEACRFRSSCRSGDLESVLEIFDHRGEAGGSRGHRWHAKLTVTLHGYTKAPVVREWEFSGLHSLVDLLSSVDEDWIYAYFASQAPYSDVNGIITILIFPIGKWALKHEPECQHLWNH